MTGINRKTKVWFSLAALVTVLSFAAPAGFAQTTYEWNDKLKRGGLNVLTAPIEIAREIQYVSNDKGLGAGWTVGLIRGFGLGVMRTGVGLLELVTAPFNFPDADKAPIIQPEFPWQDERTKV